MIVIHELGHAFAGASEGIFTGFGLSSLGPTSNISRIHKHADRYLWGMGANLLTWPVIIGITPIFNLDWWFYPLSVLAMGSYDLLLFVLILFKIGTINGDKITLKIDLPWEKKNGLEMK